MMKIVSPMFILIIVVSIVNHRLNNHPVLLPLDDVSLINKAIATYPEFKSSNPYVGLTNLLETTSLFSDDIIPLMCALKALSNEAMGLPKLSDAAAKIYKEIKESYYELKNSYNKKRAQGYLRWAWVSVMQRLPCMQPLYKEN